MEPPRGKPPPRIDGRDRKGRPVEWTGAPDSAPVRPGEELDVEALRRRLAEAVPGIERDLEVEQFPGGHSNLTYLLRAGGREYVLRRPPLGPLPPRAHDMAREYRVLAAVSPLYPPAPRVYHLCEDEAVLGAPFYLMERRRGVTPRRETPPEFRAFADFPARAARAFIEALAALHAIDIRRHGLDRLGKPERFLERQVRGWTERWERAQTDELPLMAELARRLIAEIPTSAEATLLHNDYKLDNVMFAADDPGRITTVLDWEMATVGDPLVDLGIVMCYWPEAGDPPMRREAISPLTASPGWPSRREVIERYAELSGRSLAGIAYYEAFGIFKLAVVLQQIYRRWRLGQTRDERFRDFDRRVRGLAEAGARAWERK